MWDKRYHLLLHSVDGIGAATYGKLIERFGSPEEVFGASVEEIAKISRMSEKKAAQILQKADGLLEIEALMEQLERAEIYVLTLDDAAYPESLRSIHHPPPILYVYGRIKPEDARAVAIVGSRNASEYGLKIARGLGKRLTQHGITVVSGYARGIDTAGHLGALEGEGRTIMVLSNGILHFRLRDAGFETRERLASSGAIISEVFPTVQWTVGAAMARNRIVVGLSKAVVVVECGLKSGTMHTANTAQKTAKPLFVLQYAKDHDGASGNRALLEKGAEPIVAYRDVGKIAKVIGH
ncbi:MAG: DNA-processing protein DprA [Candidatus Latescibacteria bacterium]|nr:DNA-processing protein DprA [Candidatus Latescibacterota bacterium]